MSLKRKRYVNDGAGSSLCEVCTSMTSSPQGLASLMSSDEYKHHSRADLEISTLTGCHCCKMLFEKALAKWPGPRSWPPRVVALDEKGVPLRSEQFESGEQKLSCLRYKRAQGIDTAVFDICVAAVEGNSSSRFLVNAPFSTDIDSTHVMRRIEEWLAECEGHENCLTRNSSRLPSRVIYVGHDSQDLRTYESKKGVDALCIYPNQSQIKILRNLSFAPQFSEVFRFTHLASQIN
ncbi:uncharacterized protein PAC_02740 [Phialocephala subalpina]|uniref:Heterokaryon incompatibility domain-containing protein n=1 Tax=Phialocephala subalpina TaxID=576137 RepID=A0A1L7WJB5_9HELO|nr:uncharacterized protein PAC_02740 [Phialocephala subalpina]